MTRAVEQELLEIASLPWTYLQPSFHHFLLRQPVSASPIEEANAEEKVRNLQDQYFIIQGPPGTGKTKLVHQEKATSLRGDGSSYSTTRLFSGMNIH